MLISDNSPLTAVTIQMVGHTFSIEATYYGSTYVEQTFVDKTLLNIISVNFLTWHFKDKNHKITTEMKFECN